MSSSNSGVGTVNARQAMQGLVEARGRTEEDALHQKSLTLELGGEVYEVPVLNRKDARGWKERVTEEIKALQEMGKQALLARSGSPTEVLDKAKQGVEIMAATPDLLFDLLCEYSPAMKADRDTLDDTATDAEIVVAMEKVMEVALPFTRAVQTLLARG